MAHKKGAGSTKNGRDSQAKRLGIKMIGKQPIKVGQIIVRQRGYSVHAGKNVGVGRDFTLYALTDGYVNFTDLKDNKKQVSVDLLLWESFINDLGYENWTKFMNSSDLF